MIFGRPTNLWLGLTAAIAGFVSVAAISAGVDPTLVANLVGSGVGVLGAIIVLVANQPPTVNPGDTITVTTPKGEPNASVTVQTP